MMSGNNVYVNVIEISSTGWVSRQRLRIDELVRKLCLVELLKLNISRFSCNCYFYYSQDLQADLFHEWNPNR